MLKERRKVEKEEGYMLEKEIEVQILMKKMKKKIIKKKKMRKKMKMRKIIKMKKIMK